MNLPSIRQLLTSLFRSRYLVQLENENTRLIARVKELESQGEQVMSNLLQIAGGPGILRTTVENVPMRTRAAAPSQWLRAMEQRNRKNPETVEPAKVNH